MRGGLTVARVRFFAQARDAAGTREAEIGGSTLAEVLEGAVEHFGVELARVLEISSVWVNGEEATPDQPVAEGDEVAVLPPVSGG